MNLKASFVRAKQFRLLSAVIGLGLIAFLLMLYWIGSLRWGGLSVIPPQLTVYPSNRPTAVALSPHGELLAIATWGEKQRKDLHNPTVATGNRGVNTPAIGFWDTQLGKLVRRVPVQPLARAMTFSGGGATVVVAFGRARLKETGDRADMHLLPAGAAQLREVLVETGEDTYSEALPWLPVCLRLSHEGNRLAVYGCAQGEATLRVYDYPGFRLRFEKNFAGIVPVTYEPEWQFDPMTLFGACDFSFRDDIVFVGVNRSGGMARLFMVAVSDGSLLCELKVPAKRLSWISATQAENELLVAADGGLHRWHLDDETCEVETRQEHLVACTGVLPTNSESVAIGWTDHPQFPCYLFDLNAKHSVAVFGNSNRGPNCAAATISEDRKMFATSHGYGGKVTVWKVNIGVGKAFRR